MEDEKLARYYTEQKRAGAAASAFKGGLGYSGPQGPPPLFGADRCGRDLITIHPHVMVFCHPLQKIMQYARSQWTACAIRSYGVHPSVPVVLPLSDSLLL